MEENKQIGYKGFKEDLKCLSFQFAIGYEYTHPGDVMLCHRGFHYCNKLSEVFNYYPENKNHIYCIVEPSGKIIKGGDKNVCQTIKIVRQLSNDEVIKIIHEE